MIRETQEKVDDGLERVFVITTVKDETSISEYMGCFQQKEIDNAKFPKLTNRVNYLNIFSLFHTLRLRLPLHVSDSAHGWLILEIWHCLSLSAEKT